MLNKFEVSVARDEVEGVDTLRYSFEKLLAQAVSNCIMPLTFPIRLFTMFYSEMKQQQQQKIHGSVPVTDQHLLSLRAKDAHGKLMSV